VLTVGVLALQGDVEAHARVVDALGHRFARVATTEALSGVDALVMPGGETTTMLKLLQAEDMLEPLAAYCASGRPVLGTCAGAILLASEVVSPAQPSLGTLDLTIERNAYGRQRDSFVATAGDEAPPWLAGMELVFIRAPIIRRVGEDVEVLLEHGGHPVLVRRGPVWAATFHPEMAGDPRVLERVLSGAEAAA